MIRRILFVADMSAYAPVVLGHAQEIAKSFSATIDILHTIEPMGVFAEAVLGTYVSDETLTELREKKFSSILACLRQRMVDNFVSEFENSELLGDILVEVGEPADILLAYVERQSCDLVVMGSNSSAGRLELIKLAQQITDRGRVPVMLVP